MREETLSDPILIRRLDELLAYERRVRVEFLLHLGEFDRRRLHATIGYASLWDYCSRHLRLSAGSTHRRIAAARLLARFPQLADPLRDGRLSLTALAEMRDVLDESNVEALVPRAYGRSREQVQLLVAALRPQPAPARTESIRKRPLPRRVQVTLATSTVEVEVPPRRHDQVRPRSADLSDLRLTVDRAFLEQLEEVRALLSHKLPGASTVEVLREALRLAQQVCGRRKGLTHRPRTTPETAKPARGRTPPAAVRRAVWVRDGGRCTWELPGGGLCGSTHQVEFDHGLEVALGGPSTLENAGLLCRQHNFIKAQMHLGKKFMEKFRARSWVPPPWR